MVPLTAGRPDGARSQPRQLLRGDRAGRRSIPATSCRASTSPTIRCCRDGCSRTPTRSYPAGRRELPRAPDQPAEVPDAQLPARRRAAHGRRTRVRSLTSRTASRRTARARIRQRGFHVVSATLDAGDKVRQRSETFADHYSQARLFWRSMSEPEQRHIVNAFTFELSKVSTTGHPPADARAPREHRCAICARGSKKGSAWKDRPRRSRRRARRST